MTKKQIYWEKHISAWQESGLAQAAYCRKHGISSKSFGYYKRKLASAPETQLVVPVPNVVMPSVENDGCRQPIKLYVRGNLMLAIEPGFWWARVALAEVLRQLDLEEDAALVLEEGWRYDIEQEFVRDRRVLMVIPQPPFPGHKGADCVLDAGCRGAAGVSSPWEGRIALARGRYDEAVDQLPAEDGFIGGLRGLALGSEPIGDHAGLYRRYAVDRGASAPQIRVEAAARALELDPADTVAAAMLLGLSPT